MVEGLCPGRREHRSVLNISCALRVALLGVKVGLTWDSLLNREPPADVGFWCAGLTLARIFLGI